MKRKMIIWLLTAAILVGCIPSVSADTLNPGEASPMWDQITSLKSKLAVSDDGTANIFCFLAADVGTTRVRIQTSLQQLRNGRWYTLTMFSAEEASSHVALTRNHQVPRGYDYRLNTVFLAYRGSTSERVSQLSNVVSYR